MKRSKKIYFFILVPARALWSLGSTLMLISLLTVSSIYFLSYSYISNLEIFKTDLADIETIMNWKPHNNTVILDKEGNTISEQFNEYHIFVPYEKIPEEMINTILATEDRKFWKHRGVDIYAIIRAAKVLLQNKKGGIKQGASTITQQVVKNLLLTNEKTFARKFREIVLAVYLEQVVSKEKILEIYCNQIFLGSGAYGVGAAAKRYFNKNLEELDHHEMALIAGLFQSPGKYNPRKYPERAKRRQEQVLIAMRDSSVLTEKQFKVNLIKELDYHKYESQYGKHAPYFVDHVVEESEKILAELGFKLKDSGLKIYTTLDPKLNQLAVESFNHSQEVFKNLESSIVFDNKKEESIAQDVEGAMLVLDRKTGDILSMIGGRNYEQSQFNRVTKALRAPGSVFKSITYALALERGYQWNKQYYVAPITVGNYRPRTQHSKLFSETTLLQSFYQSINSTAVALGQELGVKKVLSFAQKLGIETPLKDEAATLLGSSEVTLMDMGRVYSVFGNKGRLNKLKTIVKIEDQNGNIIYDGIKQKEQGKRVLSEATNELIVEGLKSVVRYGTGYKARHLSGRVAGKTGTSNKSKDNWFCGFTDDLVIITWLGNDDQNSFRGHISASNTAVAIWSKFASKSIYHLKTKRLSHPRSLRVARVNPRFGHRDTDGVGMYFRPHALPKEEKSDLELLEKGYELRVGLDEL